MSLIHKALKKVEGSTEEKISPELPAEEFIGKKPGIAGQFTPRTVILLVLALLALGFMFYKRIYKKSDVYKQLQPAPAAQVAGQPQMPLPGAGVVPQQAGSFERQVTPGVEEAKKLFESGSIDAAMVKFMEEYQKNPNDPYVMNDLGLVYKKKNDLGKAENYYKAALAAKPDFPECLNNLAVLKMGSGDTLEAAVNLKKAIKINPEYADAYFNLGVLNDTQGNFADAIKNYKQFLQYTDSKDSALITKVEERVEQLSE